MSAPSPAASGLSIHDGRPFFEKALAYGLQYGVIDADKIAAIRTEAPKGMVQIARYFGSEFLRPDLERARARIVNLVSLHLEDASEGDLRSAAELLRDHSFMSRSKAGSDMLRRLIAMPESSHFGMRGFSDAETPLLSAWSLRTHAEYRAELARRTATAHLADAALWLGRPFKLDADALEEAGADAEAVIRTALLYRALAPGATDWPDAVQIDKRIVALRKRGTPLQIALPPGLPAELRETVEAIRRSVVADLPRLLEATQPVRLMLRAGAVWRERYFLVEDPLGEVDHYYQSLGQDAPPQPGSKTWARATQGHEDEHSLLTLLLCLAAGIPKKTLLTEKQAASLVRRIRKHGMAPALANAFVDAHAPEAHRDDYRALWASFLQESEKTLRSDLDYQLHDALALLRRECNIAA